MLPAFVLLIVLLIPSMSFGLHPEQEYRKLQERLQEEKRKLNEVQERESSVLNEIDDVNRKLYAIDADLRKFRKNLKQTETAMVEVKNEIQRIEQIMERQKKWISRKLRSMNRLGYGGDALSQLLNSEDTAQLIRTWKYLEMITKHEHRLLTSYSENLKKLDLEKVKLEALRKEYINKEQKVKGKEEELSGKKKEKEGLLYSVRTEKEKHQKMIVELKNASHRLLEIIREASKTDDYEGKGFQQLKGKLIWPVEGRIAVPYGSHKDPQFDTVVFRNGVHIKSDGTHEVRSVYSGKVIFADWFKGFGQLIIINHGSGYHTLYGNLSEIFSKVGDIIKEKQPIGRAGTSGLINAAGIYFEVRYKGKPLDPSQWLKKRKN